MDETFGFVLFLLACLFFIVFFTTLALIGPNHSRAEQIEHAKKSVIPMQVVWKDGTHAHCALYRKNITCLETK